MKNKITNIKKYFLIIQNQEICTKFLLKYIKNNNKNQLLKSKNNDKIIIVKKQKNNF